MFEVVISYERIYFGLFFFKDSVMGGKGGWWYWWQYCDGSGAHWNTQKKYIKIHHNMCILVYFAYSNGLPSQYCHHYVVVVVVVLPERKPSCYLLQCEKKKTAT